MRSFITKTGFFWERENGLKTKFMGVSSEETKGCREEIGRAGGGGPGDFPSRLFLIITAAYTEHLLHLGAVGTI